MNWGKRELRRVRITQDSDNPLPCCVMNVLGLVILNMKSSSVWLSRWHRNFKAKDLTKRVSVEKFLNYEMSKTVEKSFSLLWPLGVYF